MEDRNKKDLVHGVIALVLAFICAGLWLIIAVTTSSTPRSSDIKEHNVEPESKLNFDIRNINNAR